MIKLNRSEEEVYAIRDKIYEETKHLTREENNMRLDRLSQKLATEFGFIIISSAGNREEDRVV
ncbi:MAG: hypothetical protein FWG63_07515 [Defluviitaleaceae bacterium]|nr:hypothetical protein [Defluviitaleaceae bacterium]